MRLATFGDELDLCARCHEQCLFSSSVVLATGRHTLAPSRVALAADLLRRGALEPSQEVADLFELGIGSGVEHANCLYAGGPTWPDETRFSRAARADLVDLGFRSRAASEAARRIASAGDPFGLGPDRDAVLLADTTLFFIDAATRAHAPQVADALRRLVMRLEPDAGPLPSIPLGSLPSSAGFEALELGLEADARELASALQALADRLGASRIVSESPEALVALRELGTGGHALVHASEWLCQVLPAHSASDPRPARATVLHDSSRLGRALGIYDPPRQVLDTLPRLDRRELRRSRAFAAPSGPTYGFPDAEAARVMALAVLDEVRTVGGELIVTTSAYDRRNLAAVAGPAGVEVRDLLELVAEGAA